MELDDLKQVWKEETIKKPINKNIMEMIQHKSYGPVAALKKLYRKQIIFMSLMPFLLLLSNFDDITRPLTSIIYWSYVAFCIGFVAFVYLDLQVAESMQRLDGKVILNIEQQINLLEKRLRWRAITLRAALLFFILLTEVVPYVQHYRVLDEWHSFPFYIRYGVYVSLLLLQAYLLPKVLLKKFGRHLVYLKSLVSEMK